MRNLVTFFTLGIISFLSCQKEPDNFADSWKHCKDGIKFQCIEPKGVHFFSGKIDNIDFCVSGGVDGYYVHNAIWTVTATSTQNPVYTPGLKPFSSLLGFSFQPPILNQYNGIAREFSPAVNIYSPEIKDTVAHSPKEFIEKFIHKGDLVLRDRNIDAFSGFSFGIGWSCVMLPGYGYYIGHDPEHIPIVHTSLSPSLAPQKNAVFKITNLVKTLEPNQIRYEIEFQIECDLYYLDLQEKARYYGRLTEGVFRTSLAFPKDE